MARSTATIQQGILANIQADPLLGSMLTSTSVTALFRLMAYVMAACQNLLEQSWDDYLAQITTYSQNTPAASLNWIASQAFLFQYDPSGSSATNDLTILPNGALGYATVAPQFNIVTRCAAITTANNNVHIKVAQAGTPAAAITGAAYTQLQSYFDAKGTAGVNYIVTSGSPDEIIIVGTVYYKPGFGGIVKDNVEAALNNYLNSIAIYSIGSKEPINYEGIIKVSEIIDTVKNADGVDDFALDKLFGHANGALFANATVVYDLSSGTNYRSYILQAGYGIEEITNSGYDWGTTIQYLSA